MAVEKLLRFESVKEQTGLSRSGIYSRMAEGSFPTPVSIGPRAIAWPESSIQKWIGDCIAASKKSQVKGME